MSTRNMSKWISGDRVQWACRAEGCSGQVHQGSITALSPASAMEMGLPVSTEFEAMGPSAGVVFDDRPGVIDFVPLDGLRRP